MKPSTEEWIQKAEDDIGMATRLGGGPRPYHDGVVFHCQQAAEKYLKGMLEELGVTFPKTHDLETLLQ